MNASEIANRIKPVDMVIEGDRAWGCLAESNYLVEIDLEYKSVVVLGNLEEKNNHISYSTITKYKNRLFFSPKEADDIVVYDLEQERVMRIALNRPEGKGKEVYRETLKLQYAYHNEKTLYLLGFFYPGIVLVDMETLKVDYIDEFIPEIEKHIEAGDEKGYFGEGYFEEDGKVYFPCGCCSALIELNLSDNKTKFIEIKSEMRGFSYMLRQDDFLWFLGRIESYGTLMRYSMRTGISDKIENIENRDYVRHHFMPFWKLYAVNNKIWLFPTVATSFFEVDSKNMSVQRCCEEEILTTGCNRFGEIIRAYMVKVHDRKAYMIQYDGTWMVIDLERKIIDKSYLKVSKEDMYKELSKKVNKAAEDREALEENTFGLENFINIIVNR